MKPSDHNNLPPGFRFSGEACGIKESGKPDLSLIVTDAPVVAAGVYTTNQIVAAPVLVCRSRTPSSRIRAVITNSGNANACTGESGMQDANSMCELVAEQIGCDADEVLVMSTGVIGEALPIEKVNAGIRSAFQSLAADSLAFDRAADAILTTDKARKTTCLEVPCGSRTFSLAAMAKGAGMIAPNMATMLAVVVTDAPLSPETARDVLQRATQKSFNRVSVDGHTSTNDTYLLLSSGSGETLAGDELEQFATALDQLSIDLAKQLVADGEGATHVMAIRVTGAASDQDAELIAKTVAASALVKTAITGGDPNWGRIVSAAGYAEAKIDPDLTCLQICGVTIYDRGTPQSFDAKSLSETMKNQAEVPIVLQVGDGPGQADYWSSDLTTEYVRFNSEYTT